jgi:8-hydroxy-5-deazaflavin:NADPH oxidoreductase
MATLKEIAADWGAEAATLEEVVKDVEVIIFSIPFKAYKDLSKNLLQGVPQEVTIMDTSNYCPLRDGELPGLQGKTESEYISETLGRPVTKVFNNIMEHTLRHKGKDAREEGRIAISVAGDNGEHKRVAAGLVNVMVSILWMAGALPSAGDRTRNPSLLHRTERGRAQGSAGQSRKGQGARGKGFHHGQTE